MLMTAADYRESLRRYSPKVFVNGDAVTCVADDPRLAPGINAVGVTYDFAHMPQHQAIMTAKQSTSGKIVNRMARTDDAHGTDYSQRFLNYMHRVQDEDLTLGVAMTDAKGDRSKRPGLQANPDTYVHIAERRPDGIVIRGTKAIVTGAPYMHEFLVMPCRTHVKEDADFAVCCAVPVDAPGVTIVARPAGRPGEAAAKFSSKYGQSTGV